MEGGGLSTFWVVDEERQEACICYKSNPRRPAGGYVTNKPALIALTSLFFRNTYTGKFMHGVLCSLCTLCLNRLSGRGDRQLTPKIFVIKYETKSVF